MSFPPPFPSSPGRGKDEKSRPLASPFARWENENFFSRLMKRQTIGAAPAYAHITRSAAPAWSPRMPDRPLTYWWPAAVAQFGRWQDLAERERRARTHASSLIGPDLRFPHADYMTAQGLERGFSDADVNELLDDEVDPDNPDDLELIEFGREMEQTPFVKRVLGIRDWATQESPYQERARRAARFHLPAILRETREFVCERTVETRVEPEYMNFANIGSDYLVLRMAGFTQKQVIRDLLPVHHINAVNYSTPCSCMLNRSAVEPWAAHYESIGRAHPGQTPASFGVPLSRRRLHNLWSMGLFDGHASGRDDRNLSVSLTRIGSFSPNVSLEALCLKWPALASPAVLAPWMASAGRGAGDGLPPVRMTQVLRDWHAYKTQADLIGRAISRSSPHRLVYLLAHRNTFEKAMPAISSRGDPEGNDHFFTLGLAIDLSPASPGIYCSTLGFFPLKSASPADDYLAWLLAFLLMDGLTHHVVCYSVQPASPRILPGPWDMSVHAQRPGPFPRMAERLRPMGEYGKDFNETEASSYLAPLPVPLRRTHARPLAHDDPWQREYKPTVWTRPESPPPGSPFAHSARASPAFSSAAAWMPPDGAWRKPGRKRPRDQD